MSDEPHEEELQSHQDPISNNTTITLALPAATNDDSLVVPEHLVDCNNALLDSMDGCVDYVEGIHSQYEEQQTITTLPQELDYLNLCGTENDIPIHDDRKVSPKGTNALSSNPTSPYAENTSSCAICLEEDVFFAKLPCCDKATSTVQICTSCILLLSSPTSDGTSRVGKCPRCRSWLVIKEEVITTVSAAGPCRICHQIKDHLVEEDAICDACFLGRQCPLLYECRNCHTTQRIPHPMYRYQSSPMQFGTVTWACHGLCANFTYWRILPDQVRHIPVGDFPEVWQTDWVAVARARLQRVDRQDREPCILL
ncbi:hypothetical protein FisN_3Lh381 [Fistulifera solaris]|uniref:RING-type domain-containing protein n=1 Tax=Fistulifera solaris TaxID=1519565 RepID=A0A1Z5J8B5_FISSO|nr:hypothetical protein FisN_3Lh381 [Fistulifera solaris]|eukprot:GAX10186.1 hypothetical protein FisN_3Lh381 [Fistulifera solaris]